VSVFFLSCIPSLLFVEFNVEGGGDEVGLGGLHWINFSLSTYNRRKGLAN